MDATSFLVLAASVNRLVEAFKPSLKNLSDKLKWSDDGYTALVQATAMVLGVVLAFIANGANLLPVTLPVPPVVGVVLTGLVVGLGADAVNLVIDFLYSWQRPEPPPADTAKG
jgi:hypothetical protein